MVTKTDLQGFAARLNSVLDEHGYPPKGKGRQTAVGRRYGVSQKGARKWLEGEGLPDSKRAAWIAKDLNVSYEWLMTGRGSRQVQGVGEPADNVYYLSPNKVADGGVTPGPDIKRWVPQISWVQAGQWAEIVDAYQPGDAEEMVAVTKNVGPSSFALRVQGDSMEPLFPAGSIIIVDPDGDPKNGSYVVVRLDDAAEATFKQLVVDGSRQYLKPLNPRYPIIEVDEDATICGVVRAMEMHFD